MFTERPGQPRQRGFTLIELIIFIVVVSVGLVGILSVLNITVQHSADPVYPKQALAIAEALMEEIQAKDFAAPVLPLVDFVPSNPPAPAERQYFDNVADFNNYGVQTLPSTLRAEIDNITGDAITILSNYRVLVAVSPAGAALNGIPAADILVITVTVTDPGNSTHSLTGYRINYD